MNYGWFGNGCTRQTGFFEWGPFFGHFLDNNNKIIKKKENKGDKD
jgi:hypothetical protein